MLKKSNFENGSFGGCNIGNNEPGKKFGSHLFDLCGKRVGFNTMHNCRVNYNHQNYHQNRGLKSSDKIYIDDGEICESYRGRGGSSKLKKISEGIEGKFSGSDNANKGSSLAGWMQKDWKPQPQFFDKSPRRVGEASEDQADGYSVIEKTQEMINKKFKNLEHTLNRSKIDFNSFVE